MLMGWKCQQPSYFNHYITTKRPFQLKNVTFLHHLGFQNMFWFGGKVVGVSFLGYSRGKGCPREKAPGTHWDPSECAKSPRGPVKVPRGHIPEGKSKKAAAEEEREKKGPAGGNNTMRQSDQAEALRNVPVKTRGSPDRDGNTGLRTGLGSSEAPVNHGKNMAVTTGHSESCDTRVFKLTHTLTLLLKPLWSLAQSSWTDW